MARAVSQTLLLGLAAAATAAVPAGLVWAAPQQFVAAEFPARVLAAHNQERARVGLAPLAWDPVLAEGAGLYAGQMAATGAFVHSDRRARPGVGENLWMGSRSVYPVEAMIGGWTSERRYFVPGIFPNNSSDGNWLSVSHYTQMIWPTTTRIGCALGTSRSGDYLVCRYSPKGNVDGKLVGYQPVERG
ncbi:MAG: CAP domain-containing protein [Sphingomicrobium sp.]